MCGSYILDVKDLEKLPEETRERLLKSYKERRKALLAELERNKKAISAVGQSKVVRTLREVK